MRTLLTIITLFSGILFCNAQTLVWNGNVSTDFFNEGNWQEKETGVAIPVPANNASSDNILKWNTDINRNLEISNAALVDSWNNAGIIKMGSGILTITNSNIKIKILSSGTINLEEGGYLEVLDNTSPIENGLVIDLKSGISWIKIKNLKPEEISTNHLSKIKVNNAASVYQTNLRLDNYYGNGTIIRSNLNTTTPVTFYDRPNLTGTSVSLSVDAIHSGSAITNLNNKIESFVLKKGYMLTIADDEAGTGKSKNYIASEADLTINKLPTHLLNSISFVRVVPWNWVTKKGIAVSGNASLNEVGGTETTLGNTWYYRWSNTHDSNLNGEYTPMSWGANGADDDADITKYKQEYKATHVLSFNESDHCTGQSGQFRNLCMEDVAVGYHRNLMKTGLRIVSPAGRENAPFGWLRNFYDKATAQDIRIDVIAVHWYDWGSNPENNPNHSATTIFNRFKTYLTNVHNEYGLPIWITEFNANRYRNNAIQLAFMQLALPYLETLDYVERYAWFEPVNSNTAISEGTADYYDDVNFNLTNVGTYFLGHNSSPSIPETTFTDNGNIGKNHENNLALNHNIVTNGNFKIGNTNAWLGYNNQVLTDTDDVSTSLDIFKNESVGNINNGEGELRQAIEVVPGVSYTVTFDYKWAGAGNHNLTAQIRRDLTGNIAIASKILETDFDVWYTESINFTAPANVFKARVFFYKANGNRPLRITNLKVRVKPDKTWNGKVNNNWNTAGNWVENSVPSATDVVLIPRNLENYPTVTTNLTLEHLFIDSGASFITTGTVSGGVTYFADLPDDKWHLLSAPISGQTMNTNWVAAAGIATGQGSNIAIGSFQNGTPDSTTGPWEYFTGTASNFTNGKGYSMKKLSEGMFIFSGNIPSGTQNIPITQGAGSNWNLIGNTFPSYIDINSFLTTNTNPLTDSFEAVYVWNSETSSYNALTTGFIHPGQAFFVNANAASTQVNIEENMLSHQENVLFHRNNNTQNITSLHINISNSSTLKTTEIEYIENKTKGLDPRFDIGLFNGVDEELSIYTNLLENNQGIKFQKQALPNSDFESMVIPLGVKAAANEEITFTIETLNLEAGLNVFLEDRANNTTTPFDKENSNYIITLSEALNGVGRFYLHTTTKSTLSFSDVILESVRIYKSNNSTLRLVGLSQGNTNVKLFNILGKQMMNTSFKANGNKDISLPNLATGVYVVQLTTDAGKLNKKIVLE